MINKISSKKGIALNNLVLLITILISLAVGIVILFSSGFAPSMKDSACVVMLRIASIGRGIIVALFDKVFDTVIIIIGVAFSYAVATSLARGGGVGTAILLGVYAVATAAVTSFIYYQVSNTYSLIPFFYCGTSEIRVGNLNGKTTATSEDLFKLISERSLDCYAMFGSGKYDPLRGKDPPDPITCFVIEYNITNNFTAKDLIDYMHWYDAVKKVYVNKCDSINNFHLKSDAYKYFIDAGKCDSSHCLVLDNVLCKKGSGSVVVTAPKYSVTIDGKYTSLFHTNGYDLGSGAGWKSCKYLPWGSEAIDTYCKCNDYDGIADNNPCHFMDVGGISSIYFYEWNLNYPSDSYWNKINGRLITINVKDKAEMNSFENNFKSNNFSSIGRVFIKYGEDEGRMPYNANYGSEDCHIFFKEDLIKPLKEFDIDSIDEDYIFLCFQEGIE